MKREQPKPGKSNLDRFSFGPGDVEPMRLIETIDGLTEEQKRQNAADGEAIRLAMEPEIKDRYRSQIREVINRNVVVSLALQQGFNAFLPVYDGGVDFILYREVDADLRKVQLKGRWTIDKKYIGRDIWIAFPVGADWYLVQHDVMVGHAEANGKTLKSASWVKNGLYSRAKPSAAMMKDYAPYKFMPIAEVAAEAADDAS